MFHMQEAFRVVDVDERAAMAHFDHARSRLAAALAAADRGRREGGEALYQTDTEGMVLPAGREAGGEVDESSASWQDGYRVGFEHAEVSRGAGYSEALERVREVLVEEGVIFRSRAPIGRKQARAFVDRVARRVLAVLRGPEREAEGDKPRYSTWPPEDDSELPHDPEAASRYKPEDFG